MMIKEETKEKEYKEKWNNEITKKTKKKLTEKWKGSETKKRETWEDERSSFRSKNIRER